MPQPTASALSVSEVNRRARLLLEQGIGEVWVEGELSGVSRPASGHVYFTLKDSSAQLRGALFRNRARFVAAPMRDGDRVRVRGRVSLFEPRGDYQLIAEAVQPAGEGELLLALERLKQRLAAEGVFANARPLPCPPRHLLVLTSPTGAAIRDVLAVLAARWPLAHVTLIAVPVQGREAAPALIAALGLLNRQQALDPARDVILITRGGGSLEDLWAFNDEHLARAIFHSRLPVMSAVGHEVDVTLSDLAADVRAPTPSAAAEMLVPDGRDLRQRLAGLERQLWRCTQARLEREGQRLDHLRARLRHPGEVVARQRQTLGELEARLRRAMHMRLAADRRQLDHLQRRTSACHPRRGVERAGERLARARARLAQAMQRDMSRRHERLAGLARQLQAVSPLAVLGRGYAILQDDSGRVIRRAADTEPGQALTARLGEGRLKVEVKRRLK
ncbi:exodeoxyribonuclease VII large subunit [Halomonas sp. MCCC 1A17488]|uniref:exodeoxyribonuclease VII large subunit n=1 Tax=unclassified Halomonas TaxID=2609666 RepID=UPI0018D1F6E0|nr:MULTISPECIES: exodeoxyribonuclease VII large subunit [unclassified Halomonas]MCE8016644.1 exodeoxyribonuclease VII large subunit [Halomonas sp. MCCC 1A17488]MCG3239977.1 exodeoxyribonuclease VII large subunit [Halomonas sp. MCCC 1A17488]QPP50132.1 exodeoxyribonuclease VII large subunit [Halomonas sp. SS10-MC5]